MFQPTFKSYQVIIVQRFLERGRTVDLRMRTKDLISIVFHILYFTNFYYGFYGLWIENN